MLYHITEDGPKPCGKTVGVCPYAKDGGEHFASEKEAFESYNKGMTEQHGLFTTKKAAEKPQVFYFTDEESRNPKISVSSQYGSKASDSQTKAVSRLTRFKSSSDKKVKLITEDPSKFNRASPETSKQVSRMAMVMSA